MRETWARRIAMITGLLVLVLAAVFSLIQNPSEQTESIEAESADSRQKILAEGQPETISLNAKKSEAGREVYRQQACARCHSIAGEGNPRNPLDGVGDVYSREEIREWITAGNSLRDELPEYLIELKQKYRNLNADELESLTTYIQSLR